MTTTDPHDVRTQEIVVGEEIRGMERSPNYYSHLNREQLNFLLGENAVQLAQAREYVIALEASRDILLEAVELGDVPR